MNNEVNDNIVFLDKNKKYKKIGIALLGVLIIIAFIFLLDYLSVLFFNNKPFIVINKNTDKYSSLLYDVYICDDELVIKGKNQKYVCSYNENNGYTSSDNNNIDNDNTNISNNSDINIENNNNIDDNSNINSGSTDSNSGTDTDNNTGNTNTNNNVISKPGSNSDISINLNENIIAQGTVLGKDITIVDRSNGGACAQAIDYYYVDSKYKYYFTCIKSNSIYVQVNGSEDTLKRSLNSGIVTMDELISIGFKPLKESRNLSEY